MNFKGKTIAITGAGSAFGKVMMREFSKLGGRMFGCDIVPNGMEEIKGLPDTATALVDLSNRKAAAQWIADVEKASGGAIDVLINNAGGTLRMPFSPIEEVTDEDWDRLFGANLQATFATTRAAAKAMKAARKGAIVNISSNAGIKPSLTGMQGYTSSKHAVVGFTRQMAVEFGPYGIRVNSVAPGLVLNDAAKQSRWDGYGPERQQAKLERTALRRNGTNEEIVNAAIFLSSDQASYITGQVLSVDGGMF